MPSGFYLPTEKGGVLATRLPRAGAPGAGWPPQGYSSCRPLISGGLPHTIHPQHPPTPRGTEALSSVGPPAALVCSVPSAFDSAPGGAPLGLLVCGAWMGSPSSLPDRSDEHLAWPGWSESRSSGGRWAWHGEVVCCWGCSLFCKTWKEAVVASLPDVPCAPR